MLRQHCFAYFHGHSAGGTNPSLLEAMAARNLICAHDNPYNREVCDSFALFFNDAADLCARIRLLEDHPGGFEELRAGAFTRAKTAYSWDRVIHDYEALVSATLK
jgi:rhamnosyltransferase